MLDDILKRQLYINRYIESLKNKSAKLLSKHDKKLLQLIADFNDSATERDIAAVARGGYGSRLARQFIADIKEITASAALEVESKISPEIETLVSYELNNTAKLLDGEPPAQNAGMQVVAGTTLGAMIAAIMLKFSASIKPDSNVKGTKEQRYRDGLIFKRDNQIRSAVDYIAQGAVNNSRNDTYAKNKVEMVDWLATLDFRTCQICANNERNSPYEVNKVPAIPHPNCRCVVVPVGSKSLRPYVKDNRSVIDIPRSERSGKIGQTRLTLDAWFKSLKESDKEEWLGAGRYELYKSGEISLDELAAGNPARTVTLESLRS